MQALVPTGVNNPNSHTREDIVDALTGRYGTRKLTFHYRLLDSGNVFLLDLDSVLSCTVNMSWQSDIKRTASFTIKDTGDIDYLVDRIQPFVRLHLSPFGTDDWVQWPQGVFLPSSPTRNADSSNTITREVAAYDLLQVFADDLVTSRYSIAAAVVVTSAISTLLGSIPKSVVASATTVPTTREWEPGTSKLKIINELLASINYESLSFDEEGYAIVKPYTSPSVRAEEYVYADDETSVILPEMDQTLDLFSVPNVWTLIVSDPDRTALVSTYTNDNPASPTSTVRRGRSIVDFRTEEDAADQTALDAKVARLAFEASQVYEHVEFSTALMPFHSGNDVYRLTYSPLNVGAKYSELSWSMPLNAGAQMSHTARRIVSV